MRTPTHTPSRALFSSKQTRSAYRLAAMTEERTAKLKLRRKKATVDTSTHEPAIKLMSPPVVDVRQSSAGSWFDKIDLTTAEWLWKQVLLGVSPDLGSVGWGAVPNIPDSTRQIAQKEEQTTVTEKFTIGNRSFDWFPFPTAHLCNVPEPPSAINLYAKNGQAIEQLADSNLSSPLKQSSQSLNASNQLESRTMNLVSKKNDGVCSKRPREHLDEQQNGASKHLEVSRSVPPSFSTTVKDPLASQKSFTASMKSYNLQKGLTNIVKQPTTSHKGSKKATQGHHQLQTDTKNVVVGASKISQKHTSHLWPTVTFAKNSNAQQTPPTQVKHTSRGQPMCGDNDIMEDINEEAASTNCSRLQERSDKVTEGAGSLVNCPICLLEFPKQFTQLDMDSHLAQCLSETTVDVVW